ncbi:MAG: ABC transporter substrate-binding protein [Bacillota bacterium]|nr:ABC transporter substrate-binding protein [Bacillota bacterium]
MKKIFALLLTFVMMLGITACSNPQQDAEPTEPVEAAFTAITFTDDLGREVCIEKQPARVATLIGSFADIWCLAGGKDTLVATADDSWTSFDLGLSDDVVNTGGIKEPNFEMLMSAEPDFVIASCNTEADVELQGRFEELGIDVAYFDIQNFDDYLNMLKICTELTGCPENYKQYGEDVAEVVDAAIARKDGSAPTVLCIRATGSSCKVKGSVDNVLGEMLADLGCVNVADNDNSLLENLSIEAIIEADPDYIFAVLQGSDSSDAQKVLEDTLLSNPAWGTLTAVKENRFIVLDNSLYNLKPNSRWGIAYENLADILFGK